MTNFNSSPPVYIDKLTVTMDISAIIKRDAAIKRYYHCGLYMWALGPLKKCRPLSQFCYVLRSGRSTVGAR